MGPSVLLVLLVLQGLFYDQSLASSHQPLERRYVITAKNEPVRNNANGELVDQSLDRQIQVDAFGVERSLQPLNPLPPLHDKIANAIKPFKSNRKWISSAQQAETLLRWIDFNNSVEGPLIKSAWETALNYTGVNALPTRHKKHPVKVAAHVYSMSEYTYDGKKPFARFNDVTSRHMANNLSFETYPFMGFYGLLLLNTYYQSEDLYRGVSFPVDAEKNQYIRFNRYLSTSIDKQVAIGFAGQGTLFIIRGGKLTNYITPYSRYPSEQEYLVHPHTQFLVADVDKTKQPWVITLDTVKYS